MMFKTAQIIILGIIALFVLFFVTRPLFADIRVVQEEASNYRTAVEQAAEFDRLLADRKANQERISALERDRLDALLPDNVDVIRTLVNLEALANAQGMIIETAAASQPEMNGNSEDAVTPSSKLGVQGVATQEVTLDVLGTYSQFTSFLEDLEASVPLIEIDTLSFELSEGDLTRYSMILLLPEWAPESSIDGDMSTEEPIS